MTRVLFVSHSAQLGGAELYLIDLVGTTPDWRACFLEPGPAVQRLRSAGARVAIVAAGESAQRVRRGSGSRALLQAAHTVVATGVQIAREARSVDVIWANSQKALFFCAVAAFISRRPLVWGLHDHLLRGQIGPSNRAAAIVVSRLFARAVAVNSQATREAYAAAGGIDHRVRLVPNGFAPEADEPAANDIRAELGLRDQPLLGLFGRISPWKGQHVLIDALAERPNCHALIVGAPLFGEYAYLDQLIERCRVAGVADRVHFLGFRKDVRALMRQVDVAIHCSIEPEPFGRVIAEAMLVGTPVIATEGGGAEEIIHHRQTGLLVPANDPVLLGSAIDELLADRLYATCLAQRAAAHIAEHYSLEAARQAAEATIACVVRRRRRSLTRPTLPLEGTV